MEEKLKVAPFEQDVSLGSDYNYVTVPLAENCGVTLAEVTEAGELFSSCKNWNRSSTLKTNSLLSSPRRMQLSLRLS